MSEIPMSIKATSFRLSATTAGTDRVAIPGSSVRENIAIFNAGPSLAFVTTGSSSTTLAFPGAGGNGNGAWCPAGQYVVYSRPPSGFTDDNFVAVTASGTADLYITTASGV